MKADYFPTTDAALDMREKVWIDKLTANGAKLGLPAAEINAMVAELQAHRDIYKAAMLLKGRAKGANSKNRTKRGETVKLMRKFVRRAKAQPGYTEGRGKGFGFVGPERNFDAKTARPRLKVQLKGGVVVIGYNKGMADGVNIYCRRGGEKAIKLGADMKPPFIDSRKNLHPEVPETREYYAIYIKNDQEAGLKSGINVIHVLID